MDERINQSSFLPVIFYLIAIISANLLLTKFGPSLAILINFLFIGLDLTLRDQLHENWSHNHLILKMGFLILAGSIFSYLINQNSGSVALASFLAFGSASVVDSITYQLLHEKTSLIKINGSNLLAALTDSILFIYIAFGSFLPWIILGMFFSKTIGGFFWSLIIIKIRGEKLWLRS